MGSIARKPPFGAYPVFDDLRMAGVVMEGLPAAVVPELSRVLGLKPGLIAALVNISPKTMARRLDAGRRFKTDESERLARMMRVVGRAEAALGSRENARRWMSAPLRVLGDRSPLSLLATEPGAREVEQVLGRIEHGVFS